ncbi:LysR family transcriptional regulator [Streptococcus chenjunshii]|uniref:LysR substrate-binding domain-containing protein n=1 Tax=Streptococcus chenjunshii TaxID=2173853 RepID=UPI00115F6964|nr:LysR family transcriptional regulator [Streptococcus chenjunshii]
MHIEKIKYFIDLYDCRSFTETARKNYISQASVSQYITSLEKEFAAQFFDRNVAPIRPTHAGKLFYNNAKLLLRQYEESKKQIQNLSERSVPRIALAYTSLSDLKLLLPLIVTLKHKQTAIDIELEKVDCKAIQSYLIKGISDAALSFSEEFTDPSLHHILLKSGKYSALVPQGHPLFDKRAISVQELYTYPLLMLSEESMGETFLTMKERSLEDGYFPNIARTVNDFEEAFFYILSEQLIGFGTEDYNLDHLDGLIRNIPIQGSRHSYKIILAYKKDEQNKDLSVFLELLKGCNYKIK